MNKELRELAELCQAINDNWHNHENRDGWKNLRLVPEAAERLRAMPMEGDTSANNQIEVISLMLECVDELSIPRQVLDIRRYQLSLYGLLPEGEEPLVPRAEVEQDIQRLEDYIDLSLPTTIWRERYHRHLNFDTVERTEEWEKVIYEAEKETAKRLGDTPRGMGFCFGYWSTLGAVMAEYGIEWCPPSVMNPGVMFD